jgi:hypothetical protein
MTYINRYILFCKVSQQKVYPSPQCFDGEEGKAAIASTGGPCHPATAEKVKVKVIHCLSAIVTGIDRDSIAIGQTDLFGDLFGTQQQVPEQIAILGSGIGEGRDGLFWNDEDMNGGLGVNVVESQASVVFVNDICRNFATNNFAKNRV